MKIKYNITVILLSVGLLLFGMPGTSLAQHSQADQPANQELRKLKIEVVTQMMHLSASQGKSFLPLYNKYSDELLVLYRQKRKLKYNQDSKFVVNERLRIDKEILDIKSAYKSQFLKIISTEQLNQMYQGEEKFKQLLIERLKK